MTARWNAITKPGDFRFAQGQWKRYNPTRTLKAEQKNIEVELCQRRNKLLWKRMEGTVSEKSKEEIGRKKKLYRVISKSEICQSQMNPDKVQPEKSPPETEQPEEEKP